MGRVSYDFSRKTVLVTGANRGIDYAVACGFSQVGSDVSILYIDNEVVETSKRLSDETGHSVTGLHCDITDKAQVQSSSFFCRCISSFRAAILSCRRLTLSPLPPGPIQSALSIWPR